MQSSIHPSRSGRVLVAGVACIALLAAAAPAAQGAANKPIICPPGFDLGARTFEETQQLPRWRAALDAGVFNVESMLEHFTEDDHNGNGILCFKEVEGQEAIGPYQYVFIDDPGRNPS